MANNETRPLCLKYSLMVLNIVLMMIGIAMLGVAIWVHVEKGRPLALLPFSENEAESELNAGSGARDLIDLLRPISVIVIVIAGVLIVTAFFGCCGAVTESRVLLVAYAIIVSMMLIGLLGVLIWILVEREEIWVQFRYDVAMTLQANIRSRISPNSHKDSEKVELVLPTIERTLSCCGVTSIRDYGNFSRLCASTHEAHSGCLDRLMSMIDFSVLVTIGFILCGLLVLGVILAITLLYYLNDRTMVRPFYHDAYDPYTHAEYPYPPHPTSTPWVERRPREEPPAPYLVDYEDPPVRRPYPRRQIVEMDDRPPPQYQSGDRILAARPRRYAESIPEDVGRSGRPILIL